MSPSRERPALDDAAAHRIERRLFGRIRRNELGRRLLLFCTGGALAAVLVLLRPFFKRTPDDRP